jgi:hypothetical protein
VEWIGGAQIRDMDLIKPLTQFLDFGNTPSVINAAEFPGGDETKAVFGPEVDVTPAMLGLSRATVTSEVINLVGYKMHLPSNPPWQETVNTEMVLSALSGYAPKSYDAALKQYGQNVAGDTQLRARGHPSDQQFANLVEVHENHHVQELKDGIRAILLPWDQKLTAFKATNESFTRTSPDAAKAALFKAAGGTPAEIGQKLVNYLRGRGDAFHHTGEGGPPTIDQVDIDEPGSRLTFYWKHPMG